MTSNSALAHPSKTNAEHSALIQPCVCVHSLYWHIGKRNFGPNAVNIGAALFMWTILPGFAAAAYTPALVQERTLFYRCSPHQQYGKAFSSETC